MTEQASKTDSGEAKPAPKSGTALRFASAIPLIALALWLMFSAPQWAFEAFGYLWIAITANELMKMAIPESAPARIWGTLAAAGLGAVLLRAGEYPQALPSALVGLAAGALFFSLVKAKPIERGATRAGILLGGPIYVAGTLATIVLLHRHENGGAWVLLSMFIAFLSDTTAYFAGRAFGKHKLAPDVSPKKSVEGAIGGLVGSVSGAVGLSLTLLDGQLPVGHAIVLALIAGACGQAGDLFESLIKRSCGVKDSGSIMPGHGGLLDRSDALMFTGSITWLYVAWMV